jgi:hypothetical protein
MCDSGAATDKNELDPRSVEQRQQFPEIGRPHRGRSLLPLSTRPFARLMELVDEFSKSIEVVESLGHSQSQVLT